MSAWIVYSKDGLTERCKLKKLSYDGSFMNERAVTSTFVSPIEIDFEIFDYIEYRGEQFEIESIPTVKKTSSFSYEYELRFVSHKYELERCEMRDIVPHDNGIVYPTPLTFSFMGDVKYLAERIQACLDAMYGSGIWNIVVADGVISDEHNITLAQQNCWNALALVNTTYKLNFYIKGRNITIGGSQPIVDHIFQYGKGNGLYEIERTANTDTGIVTKLRAFGSTRNLDYSYPKRPDWSDSIYDTSFVLSPLRLMLPSFKTSGKDYIMASDALVSQYGIREASIIYEDIYPSITGATNSTGESIDEIKSVGEVGESTFVVGLYDLGFDLEEHLTNDAAQISMKSGSLQGYTFNIQKIEKQEDSSYIITLERITLSEGDSGNYDVPNSNWNMSAGDKFVLLNILMPQEYIIDAEERLEARAEEYLSQYAKTNFSYSIGLHDKFLLENPTIYEGLIEGSRLRIQDEEIGISEDVTIQSITITENMEESILPQVKVVLNNEPSASTLERIQGQINDLASGTSGNYSKQSEILNQYRRKLDRPYFDKLFVAVDKDGKEIASNDLTTEVYYIKARYHLATVGGLTSFIDDGFQDLPQIYDGLPIDNQTLYWEETTNEDGSITKVLKAKGGSSSGGSTSGTVTWDDIEGKPDLSQYALDTDLSKYLPLTGGTLTGNLILNKASLAVWNSEVELYQSPLRMTSAYGGYDRLNISYDESGKKLCIQSGSYDGKTQRGYMSISGIEDAELQRLYINATETIFSGAIRLKKDSESIGGLITYDESGGYFSLDHSLRMGTNSINFHGAYISKDSYVGASLRIQDTDGITLSTGYEKPLIVSATGIELYGGLIEYDPTLDAFILNGNLLVTGSVTSVYTGN